MSPQPVTGSPAGICWPPRNLRDMAQRNDRVLWTTGLARMDGEHAMYTRASDNVPDGPRTATRGTRPAGFGSFAEVARPFASAAARVMARS